MLSKLLIALVKLYQVTLSGLLGRTCRFYPTCSHYAVEALQRHGALRGSWLTVCRIMKCHPFHPGGVDLVPPVETIEPRDPHRGVRAVPGR